MPMRVWLALSVCWLPWFVAASAHADVASCVAAADRGQVERDARTFSAARASFLECADAACPEAVRKECTRWLSDVEARLPSIVIVVRDQRGVDIPDAEVALDGTVLEEGSLGRELSVDPGEHVVTARRDGVELTERVMASEREQGRMVTLVLGPKVPPPQLPPASGAAEPRRRSWLGPAITAGAGAVLLGTAGIITLRGKAQAEDLRSDCSPTCKQSEVDAIERRLTLADVTLGVGIAAVAAGVAWYFWPVRKEPKTRAAVRVNVVGSGLTVTGAF
jgi:hypothetical protein